MTPSARIDSRFSAPPENMLNMLRIVPCWSWKNRANAAGSMPGTGMKVPMRYTTSPPIRKRNLPLSSVSRLASPSAATGLFEDGLATRIP